MARWLRLWMSYLKTAGLAMAVFTAFAFVYGAIRLGSDWLSLVVFGAQAALLILMAALALHHFIITRRQTRLGHLKDA